MPNLTVDADLLVEDGAGERQLSVDDFKVAATGAATQATQALVLAALEAIEQNTDGLELSLTDIDLNTDALETALSNLFTELGQKLEAGELTGLATASKQDVSKAVLDVILAAVDGLEAKDFATQATLAAILAKLIAAPATEAKQDALIGHVDGVEGSLSALNGKDFATDAKLEAVRDRLPSALDGGALSVADAYTAGQALASQAGADAVQTHTFSAARDLIWVRSVGDVSFADPFGGTPAEGVGLYCADDEPHPITRRTDQVKVWAPVGATVYVWGYGG